MKQYELIAPCHFGMEAVLKREITDLGYRITAVEDGKVTFLGDAAAVCRANICLRTAERVLLKVGSFPARTYEELFEGTKNLPWEEFIPKDGRFWVTKATTVRSALFSPSDIQSVMKKAMVRRLESVYGISWFPESGTEWPVRVTLMKDTVTAAIDTSGESLHKRGYRKMTVKAPISETLAAALIMLTPWNRERILVDPFCGSGTFPIEAAMMAADIAPGLYRKFQAEEWTDLIPPALWREVREERESRIDRAADPDIQGYDIDGEAVRAARENARLAGVGEMIHFQRRAVAELSHPRHYGFLITNPPYGERLEEKSALPEIYREFGQRFAALGDWSAGVITAWDGAEKYIGRKADKNRKIYNGMIRTYFYQFMGPRPPRRGDGRRIQKDDTADFRNVESR